MCASETDHARQPRTALAQWWAVLGPPLVWLTQFEARYALAGNVPGSPGHVAMVVIGVAALILVGTCAFAAARQWRLAEASPLDRSAGIAERSRFMGALGLSSSALFLLAILAQMLAGFFIAPGIS